MNNRRRAEDNKGLEEVFRSIFPINSASQNAALDYVSYELEDCLYTPEECRLKSISYAAKLHVNLQLRLMDKNTQYKTVKEKGISPDRVFLGEIPLMTRDGSFVVNGTERVVVSQLHRSLDRQLVMEGYSKTITGNYVENLSGRLLVR